MANYMTYGGNFMLPHPYEVKDVTGYGVAVTGERKKLQALVDFALNRAKHPSLRYWVVSPTVLFTFMQMGSLACAGDPQKGSFTEQELNVTLLLLAVDTSLGVPSVRLVWYMPYLWLDSGPALIAGRDVYGFPKQIAEVAIPDLGQPAVFSAKSEVLHREDGRPAMSGQTVLGVREMNAGILEKASDTANAGAALGILGTFFGIDENILGDLIPIFPEINLGNLKMVFMRQLASIANFNQACFRSVAEVPFSVNFHGAGLLKGSYEVSIPYHHSVRLAHELGIATDIIAPGKPGEDVLQPAKAAYHMNFDFTLGAGSDLWREYEP